MPPNGASGVATRRGQGARDFVVHRCMVRFLIRLVGYAGLALAFVLLVIDGTRTIAANELSLTQLGQWAVDYFPARMAALPGAVAQNLHPLLWDPVLLFVLKLPGWLVFAVIGMSLLTLGRKPGPQIGFSNRP